MDVETAAARGAGADRGPCAGIAERAHLVGIGGGGMSGLARLLSARGHRLSGSDREEGPATRALAERGVAVAIEPEDGAFDPEVLAGVGTLVRSAAVPLDHPCVAAALTRGIPVLKYAEALGRVAPAGRTLAVAGTHGKTTTSWMLYHALREASGDGPRPGALVGGECRRLGTNAVPPQPGGWFAVEACEYDRSFLQLTPQGAAVTNVEADHLDYYGDLAAIEEAFARFVDRVPPDGLVVLGARVPRRIEDAARAPVWRLGRELEIDLAGESRGRFRFRLRGPGWAAPETALGVPGSFNVENAALALALAVGLAGRAGDAGDAAADAARGLAAYGGALRRFEPWGTAGGVEVVHDYAHHPTEVRVTLEAARRAFPGRPLHVLFQPHQHSRTARFLEEFAESLRAADRVVVADVYGARRHIDGERFAGAPELAARVAALGVRAELGGPLAASVAAFAAGAVDGATGLVLGAGDVGSVRDELLAQLALRRAAPRSALR